MATLSAPNLLSVEGGSGCHGVLQWARGGGTGTGLLVFEEASRESDSAEIEKSRFVSLTWKLEGIFSQQH